MTCILVGCSLQAGEQMKKMPGTDGVNPFATIIESAGGLDKIEALQQHPNEDVYEKAMHILQTYYEAEGEDENLAPEATQGQYAFGAPSFGGAMSNQFNFS
jgi:importin subunit alpha-1